MMNFKVPLEPSPYSYGLPSSSGHADSAKPSYSARGAEILENFLSGSVGGGAADLEAGGKPENASLIDKTLSFAKTGVNNARTLVTNVSGSSSAGRSSFSDPFLSTSRLVYFGIFMGIGVLFMTLSFFLLPMIVLAPGKFALCFTLGSLSFMASFCALKGIKPFLQHLASWERLPFTFAYTGSLICTLYVTVIWPSKILALLFSVTQLVALLSFLISYLPGGIGMLKMIAQIITSGIKNLFKGN